MTVGSLELGRAGQTPAGGPIRPARPQASSTLLASVPLATAIRLPPGGRPAVLQSSEHGQSVSPPGTKARTTGRTADLLPSHPEGCAEDGCRGMRPAWGSVLLPWETPPLCEGLSRLFCVACPAPDSVQSLSTWVTEMVRLEPPSAERDCAFGEGLCVSGAPPEEAGEPLWGSLSCLPRTVALPVAAPPWA